MDGAPMNQAERHFWECAEPPDGIYPTLDDYAVALNTLHQQQVTAPLVSPAPSATRQVYGEYQVGGMSIRSIQADEYFEQIVTPAGKIAVFPSQRTRISSMCAPNSMVVCASFSQPHLHLGAVGSFSDEGTWPNRVGSIVENIRENAISPPCGNTP